MKILFVYSIVCLFVCLSVYVHCFSFSAIQFIWVTLLLLCLFFFFLLVLSLFRPLLAWLICFFFDSQQHKRFRVWQILFYTHICLPLLFFRYCCFCFLHIRCTRYVTYSRPISKCALLLFNFKQTFTTKSKCTHTHTPKNKINTFYR